jgi:nitrite reductase/ring-hydroxylating ferredoxin subunit
MIDADAPLDFVPLARASDIPAGTGRSYALGRYEVALFNVGGEFYALENSCPHQGGPIADGWLEGPHVTCPWHGWCFDVRSGKMTLGEFARVSRFEVRRQGEELFVSTEPVEQA